MDELTIGDKKYVSTKKAAKLTGYAKDYVGQLSREGKVEARLVGRNWYVLEESILEHRFGAEGEEAHVEAPNPTVEPKESEKTYTWSQPTYTPEPVEELPRTAVPVRSVETAPVAVERAIPQEDKSVTDMQRAWQEWFDQKKQAREPAPEAYVSPTVEVENRYEPYTSDMGTFEAPETYEDEDTTAEYDHEPAPESVPITRVREYVEEVPIHRISARQERYEEQSTNLVQPRYQHFTGYSRNENSPREWESASTYTSPASPARKKKSGKSRKKGTMSVLSKVILLCLLGLVVIATYASVTSISESERGSGNTFINFVNGVSSTK